MGIGITTINGVLRIEGELPIPHAPGGAWDPERIADLITMIYATVNIEDDLDRVKKESSV